MASTAASGAGHSDGGFRFAIDRGGTFTDVYAETPFGVRVRKLLSEDPSHYDDAPREGIRRILEECTGRRVPPGDVDTARVEWIRMGTTVATNALLERKGERCVFVVTRGLRDLLRIGNQSRPQIFDLRARRPGVIYDRVIEVDERVRVLPADESADGDGSGEPDSPGERERDGGGSDGRDSARRRQPSQRRQKQQRQQHIRTGRTGQRVEILRVLDVDAAECELRAALDDGITSAAVAFMHSYTYPEHEQQIGELATRLGFTYVSLSSSLTNMKKIVPRGFTAATDAYLTPCIKQYVKTFSSGFRDNLQSVLVEFMQSDGGLCPIDEFSGYKAIISGPAGGVVGYARTTYGRASDGDGGDDDNDTDTARTPVIGFDMGGTSTDVSRYAGRLEHVLESETAGVTIQTPQLDVNTVAAGGGSRLFFRSGLMQVGPESAGAHPGPVCYRKAGGMLAVTDANVVLGRVQPHYFPRIFGESEDQPLDADAVRSAFDRLLVDVQAHCSGKNGGDRSAGGDGGTGAHAALSREELALGFVRVANEAMCRPIRSITEARGHEPSAHALASFGGAGGQHACAVARALGIRTVFVHRYSGILSAYGMGCADSVEDEQEPCAMRLPRDDAEARRRLDSIAERATVALLRRGIAREHIRYERYLHLRFDGTDVGMMIAEPEGDDGVVATTTTTKSTPTDKSGGSGGDSTAVGFVRHFHREYAREHGFVLTDRDVIVDDVRVRAVGRSAVKLADSGDEARRDTVADPLRPVERASTYFAGGWRHDTGLYRLNELMLGDRVDGPALLLEPEAGVTVVIEPQCRAQMVRGPAVRITIDYSTDGDGGDDTSDENVTGKRGRNNGKRHRPPPPAPSGPREANTMESGDTAAAAAATDPVNDTVSSDSASDDGDDGAVDPIKLSVFAHRFMGIAEQMGRTLQRTSVSTNIKERLDFSCALFDPDGGLVANAPHIPVHLGSMQDSIRHQIRRLGADWRPNDVIVTNHPAAGGTHLPDVTVITAVFHDARPVFYVASRGHHADVGGMTPGSMPPFSRTLADEGLAIRSLKLVEDDEFQEARMRDALQRAGCRCMRDVLSDLRAQVAANRKGIALVHELIREQGLRTVTYYMRRIQRTAAECVRNVLRQVARERCIASGAGAPAPRDGEDGGAPGAADNSGDRADSNDDGAAATGTSPTGRRVRLLRASDSLDDGSRICVALDIDPDKGNAVFDFSGTSPQTLGNLNAPPSVAASAIIYCLRCLVSSDIPLNQGCLAPVHIRGTARSILAPRDGAAVVGGNVLTSQRVTDVVLRAFGACAASQGCMNNFTFGTADSGYYETIAGGAGAGPGWHGESGVQTHMTNTRMTDPEVLELRYPVLLRRFRLRANSGGDGTWRGGDGVEREIEFCRPVTLSVLSERRVFAPYGMDGGSAGARGENLLILPVRSAHSDCGGGSGSDGSGVGDEPRASAAHDDANVGDEDGDSEIVINLTGKNSVEVPAGARVLIRTPGGGGYGTPLAASRT